MNIVSRARIGLAPARRAGADQRRRLRRARPTASACSSSTGASRSARGCRPSASSPRSCGVSRTTVTRRLRRAARRGLPRRACAARAAWRSCRSRRPLGCRTRPRPATSTSARRRCRRCPRSSPRLARPPPAAARATSASPASIRSALPALREALADRYTARGLPTDPDQIMVTIGAQHAIALHRPHDAWRAGTGRSSRTRPTRTPCDALKMRGRAARSGERHDRRRLGRGRRSSRRIQRTSPSLGLPHARQPQPHRQTDEPPSCA